MDLLLDTHTLIWFLNGDNKLSENVKSAIEDIHLFRDMWDEQGLII